MITDFNTREKRLGKPELSKSEDCFDWWTAVSIALALAFMYLFVNACLFWIDYSIIKLHLN